MDNNEKEYIKLRFGLTLKKIIDKNKATGKENQLNGIKDKNLINSYGKLETASGVPKATIIEIVQGKKNAASTTIAAILDAFEMTLSQFGILYDKISATEIQNYKSELSKAKEDRKNKKKDKRKPK